MNRDEPILDNECYHIYNRGNRRQPIFGEDSDFISFKEKLREGSKKYKVSVIAYQLMPNHFHLILSQSEGGSIAHLMTSVETSVAKRFNAKYHQIGHLFQGRYHYNRIDSEESLLTVARYIHLNPVTAGLVSCLEDWPYSDFAEYVHAEKDAFDLALATYLHYTPSDYVEFVRSKEREIRQGKRRPSTW